SLADLLLGGTGDAVTEFSGTHQSAYGEAVSQLAGTWSTVFGELLGTAVSFAPPEVATGEEALSSLGNDFTAEAEVGVVDVRFAVEGKLEEMVTVIMEKGLVDSLAPPAAASAQANAAPALLEVDEMPAATSAKIPPVVEQAVYGLELPGPGKNTGRGAATPAQGPPVSVQQASFTDLGTGLTPHEVQNIELLMDVNLLITVELGRARRQIRDVLAMGPGSVVELDRLAGEAVDVLINGKLVAKGEVVVIDENFGVRITDIVSPAERVRGL
ncbi:MAG: flagellar motor switch protein FliN, partial [Firmicutes bacterium]|nr:flagellar motor switch protein FliN [Bacillota bacterium]